MIRLFVLFAVLAAAVSAAPAGELRGLWRLSVAVPLRWVHYGVGGSHDFISASPGINVRRQFGAKSDITASATYACGPVGPSMFVGVPVLCD